MHLFDDIFEQVSAQQLSNTEFAEKVLRKLPTIHHDKLDQLKETLRQLFPRETNTLDHTLSTLEEAVALSTKEVNKHA